MSIRSVIATVVVAFVVVWAKPVAAGVVVVPVVPVGPYPYYYVPPEHLEVGNQYFDFSLRGLQRLCKSQPGLCSGEQLDTLQNMQTRHTVGLVMVVTGVAAAIAGPMWTAFSVNRDATGYRANYVPLITGVAAGIALPIAGGIIMPHRSDLVDFINDSNAAHPDNPIRLHIGAVSPRGTPGMMVGMDF